MYTLLYYLKLVVSLGLIWLFSCSAHLHQASNAVVVLKVVPRFQDEDVQLGHYYNVAENDSVQINSLRFYIGHIELWNDSQLVGYDKSTYHLMDIAHPATQTIQLSLTHGAVVSHIRFTIGIDSATNYKGVSTGDLDPAHGMYWTWQSGYIHFKLEGKSSLSPRAAQDFALHLGGYRYPFNTTQTCNVSAHTASQVVLNMQVAQLLKHVEWKHTSHIMSPGPKAVALSNILPQLFTCEMP